MMGKIIERSGAWYYQPWPGKIVKLKAKTKNEATDEAYRRTTPPIKKT